MSSDLKIRTEFTATLLLNERELRALDAMVGYGEESFLNCFYKKCGTYYLKPYEDGVHSLFDKVAKISQDSIREIDIFKEKLKNIK